MEYKIYRIGHALRKTQVTDDHNAAFSEAGLPVSFEVLDVPPVNFHREISALTRDPSFLGAKIALPYKQTALAYCQEISQTAKSTGIVNTLVRRPSGLIYGHNTDVGAFVNTMKSAGADVVRSALILGAGEAARLALAGLRDLGCARYRVGYRHPRRPTELSSQFKGIRRQMQFFPIEEMTSFFNWAEGADIFPETPTLPPPDLSARFDRNAKDSIKRWGMLINATPVGQEPNRDRSLVSTANFLRSFDRVVDLVPTDKDTPLIRMAREAEVEVISGFSIYTAQAELSRRLWLREYERRINGEDEVDGRKVGRMKINRRSRG